MKQDPGSSCPDPPSTTVIKCVFWGGPVYSTNANNKGQWRNDFEVVIAGSNGYNTAGPFQSPTGYTGAYLVQAAINAPNECNSYMGVKIFASGPFDPACRSSATSNPQGSKKADSMTRSVRCCLHVSKQLQPCPPQLGRQFPDLPILQYVHVGQERRLRTADLLPGKYLHERSSLPSHQVD